MRTQSQGWVHQMRMIALGWVLASVFIATTGCKKRLDSHGPIRIGEVASMTGSDATFGISTHRGILSAIHEINAKGGVLGRPLELITEDDQGRSSDAVLALQKLINQDQVSAVLGEVASSLSLAMAPVAQQMRVPMISPSSLHSRLTQTGEYIFRVCFIDEFQAHVMADLAYSRLHAKKVAILQDQKSDYSRDSARLFEQFYSQLGGKIVLKQSYSGGDIDFKAQLTAIRATSPDLILVPGYYTEVGLIARQKADLGIQAPLLGGDGWDSPRLIEIGGKAIENSYFVSHFARDPENPIAEKFFTQFQSDYHRDPDGLAALGYDAALVLIDAIKKTKFAQPNEIQKALTQVRDLQGVTGKITIGADRNAIKPAVVFQVGYQGRLKILSRVNPDTLKTSQKR